MTTESGLEVADGAAEPAQPAAVATTSAMSAPALARPASLTWGATRRCRVRSHRPVLHALHRPSLSRSAHRSKSSSAHP